MTMQLYRPDGEGKLTPAAPPEDWRRQLRSPRWGRRLAGGELPRLANPEMDPTSRLRSVAFWLGLGALTFVLLVAGYGSGFWS
ncbi:MAG: hypothetical protein RL338_1183 [Chloroflexota bacterium]|jgi:hypothetical protein